MSILFSEIRHVVMFLPQELCFVSQKTLATSMGNVPLCCLFKKLIVSPHTTTLCYFYTWPNRDKLILYSLQILPNKFLITLKKILIFIGETNIKVNQIISTWARKNDSEVKSTISSYRRPRTDSQHSYDSPQHS